MASVPKWASRLNTKVCSIYKIKEPHLVWIITNKKRIPKDNSIPLYGGGSYSWGNKEILTITSLNNTDIDRMNLLHELAHAISSEHTHSKKYYITMWEVYRANKVPIKRALELEGMYRKRAVTVYWELRKK